VPGEITSTFNLLVEIAQKGEVQMPLYEYQCQQCSEKLEAIQKFSDEPFTICPHCGGALKKLISSPAIKFKGSGFYITDYAKSGSGEKKSSSSSTSSSTSTSSDGSSSGSSSSSGGETKGGGSSSSSE
jgi:putative FmdB family regulatory protein